MNLLKAVGSELLGLFVDDRWFALAIVVWVLVCWLAVPRLGLPAGIPAVALFGGFVAILAASAVTRAGKGE